ncbi:MAG: dTDP-4-dehydrorhamnose reductase family protein [Pyrinomonadaceae bacterium]
MSDSKEKQKLRLLILGGSGMLGHKLWQVLSQRFDAFVTFRNLADAYTRYGIFDAERSLGGIAADDPDALSKAISRINPDAILNCIGVVKQDAAASDPLTSISVNALFPHQLAKLSRASRARLIHISTDCVFSGRQGNYSEEAIADAEDLYGRTKYLGELSGEGCLTLRTSMIGRELKGTHGLVEWFLSQQGNKIRGFRRAVFSGFTTNALATIIGDIVERHPNLEGVYNLAANPISKFDLLTLIKQKGGLEIDIEEDETFICDRSLNGERFNAATGFVPPDWSDMVENIFSDSTPYDEIRRSHC